MLIRGLLKRFKFMEPQSIKILVEENNVNYFAISMVSDAFMFLPHVKKYLGVGFSAGLMEIKNESLRYGFNLANWNTMGMACIKRLENGQLSLKKLNSEHIKNGEEIMALCQKIEHANLEQKSLAQIKAWLKAMWKPYLELNAIGSIPVLSDFEHNYLTKKLISALRVHDVAENNIQNILNTLITPADETLFWQEQKDLLEIAFKYKRLDAAINSPDFANHTQKYIWLHYGYQGPIVEPKDFIIRLEKIFTNKAGLKKQLNDHGNFLKKLKADQIKLTRQLKFIAKEKILFEAARQFSCLKIYRVGIRHYFSYISDIIFSELSTRLKLPPKFLCYCTREEILKILSGKKVNKKTILGRTKYVVEVITPKSRKFYTIKTAKKVLRRLVLPEEVSDASELHGQAAFLGKAIGKAKLVFTAKDLNKVQHGDILVALSTNPDFLPAMYRANAFVTDQGGITSHAAIVAREMKKPCIIGTKFATKVLKDGDMVEVDANKGIVRKI